MVLQKRSYFGFNGYQAPPIPRGARSFRKRGPLRKKVVDNQMCAFDLLANVADQILFEGHSPVTASSDGICQDGNSLGIVKQERQVDNHKLPNVEYCNKNNFEIDEQTQHVVGITNHQGGGGGFSSGSTSAITSSVCTDKTGDIEKKPLNDDSSQSCTLSKKLEGCSSAYTVFGVPIFENHGIGSESCSSEDPKLLNRNLSASDKYDSDVKEHVNRNHYTRGIPSPCSNNVKLVGKDDDENSSKCRQRSTVMKTGSDAKIKTILASSYWRAPPKMKDRDHYNAGLLGDEMHTLYENRKRGCSKYPRSQKIYPFKKRKLLYNLPSTSDDTTHYDYEDVYEPLEKATDMSVCDFGVLGRAATSELSEAAGESTLFTPRDSQVKLRIKSFRVPELFIELPETATVGSLKKTVMEAITTLLGGGLHIGVLVQGRKIKDDTRTLLQSGISQDNKVDTLGFILEPNHSQIHKPMLSEKPYIDIPQTLSSSLADNSLEKGDADSKSLVVIPESNMQALELMPPLQKSKRPEMGQRRIRRPFSVSEVEALVQAVEELGTGRWRDVKLRAFDNVNHRTYVDLKDKWKTLVHTARISPQQRRGEPVPQELLDRVLAAHSYWSHQQAKERPETCLLV